jgi:endonuclease-3 related protein
MSLTPSELYSVLQEYFGRQYWWPVDYSYHKMNASDPRFEIMVGAILTQNTAWRNVERALENLKHNRCLSLKALHATDEEELKTMIQPSGFFNQKAKRLKVLSTYLLHHYGGNIEKFFRKEPTQIRQELLALYGIGPETADSILLYAGNKPFFVVDAYTKRICSRLPVDVQYFEYNHIQSFFQDELQKYLSKEDIVIVYKQLHALIVELAKKYCKNKPACDSCPLSKVCAFAPSR